MMLYCPGGKLCHVPAFLMQAMLHIITKHCIIPNINGGMRHGMVKHKSLTGEENDHLHFQSALIAMQYLSTVMWETAILQFAASVPGQMVS
jgi:hypothetical protein